MSRQLQCMLHMGVMDTTCPWYGGRRLDGSAYYMYIHWSGCFGWSVVCSCACDQSAERSLAEMADLQHCTTAACPTASGTHPARQRGKTIKKKLWSSPEFLSRYSWTSWRPCTMAKCRRNHQPARALHECHWFIRNTRNWVDEFSLCSNFHLLAK